MYGGQQYTLLIEQSDGRKLFVACAYVAVLHNTTIVLCNCLTPLVFLLVMCMFANRLVQAVENAQELQEWTGAVTQASTVDS
jgi:hypothetical protein